MRDCLIYLMTITQLAPVQMVRVRVPVLARALVPVQAPVLGRAPALGPAPLQEQVPTEPVQMARALAPVLPLGRVRTAPVPLLE